MKRIPALSIGSATLAFLLCSAGAMGQDAAAQPAAATASGDPDLSRHLDELTGKLDSMRRQLMESQNEMDELRNELHSLR